MESEHGRRVPAAAAALTVGHVGGGGAGAGDLHPLLLFQPGTVNITLFFYTVSQKLFADLKLAAVRQYLSGGRRSPDF